MTDTARTQRILVTGATGYIGGRLAPMLVDAGHHVRAMVRDPAALDARPWAEHAEVVTGDVTKPDTLRAALDGIDVAYYLIHAMTHHKDFAARDAAGARHFAEAAKAAGVSHIIYLGGLQPEGKAGAHLGSRAEVGRILADACPTTEIRAGPVIGSGSASFEMVRYLTERLPIMITPRWVTNEVRPVAVRDVLAYLQAALERGPSGVIDIGTTPRSFGDVMRGYAKVRGLRRRLILPTPVLAPTLAARWVQFITPITNKIAIPLIDGIKQPVIGDTARARELFPEIEPLEFEQAVQLALQRILDDDVTTRWSGATGPRADYRLEDERNLKQEVRTVTTDRPPDEVWRTISSLGGDNGWLRWNWAWKLRGGIDRFIGGPGLRRGRRSPTKLQPGDVLDFWRVEAVVPDQLLRLRAEMKVPGRAWLQFELHPTETGGTRLVQTALFEPKGLPGVTYWNALYPIHRLIFRDLGRAVVKATGPTPRPPQR